MSARKDGGFYSVIVHHRDASSIRVGSRQTLNGARVLSRVVRRMPSSATATRIVIVRDRVTGIVADVEQYTRDGARWVREDLRQRRVAAHVVERSVDALRADVASYAAENLPTDDDARETCSPHVLATDRDACAKCGAPMRDVQRVTLSARIVDVKHERDEQCDVDPETDLCRSCRVMHGDPCDGCGRRAFHLDTCARVRVVCDLCGADVHEDDASPCVGRCAGVFCAKCADSGKDCPKCVKVVRARADEPTDGLAAALSQLLDYCGGSDLKDRNHPIVIARRALVSTRNDATTREQRLENIIADLVDDLDEAHEVQRDDHDENDPAETCSYCKHVREARAALAVRS